MSSPKYFHTPVPLDPKFLGSLLADRYIAYESMSLARQERRCAQLKHILVALTQGFDLETPIVSVYDPFDIDAVIQILPESEFERLRQAFLYRLNYFIKNMP